MNTRATFTILFMASWAICRAQPLNAGKTDTQSITFSTQKSSSSKIAVATATVLFATNEDCRLYIDEELKGNLSKDQFLYLPLTPGHYRLLAKDPATGDEWRDTFSVTSEKPTEIFIDMLYAIDAGNEKRQRARSLSFVPMPRHRSTTPAATGTMKTAGEKDAERTIAASFLAGMMPVKGGRFVMGNNHSPAAGEEEHPVLLNTFWLSRYEVTQEQWERVMGYNPSLNKGCATCPVENVSWEEVMTFLRKLNSITNQKFRLPTEAEWEYTARLGGKAELEKAGSTEAYILRTAWTFQNAENRTHPVGGKQPNAAGIHDLTGNVSEWCMDWYDAFFYKEDFTDKNPEGPPLGKEKIIRGGNYRDYLGDRFRPSFRNKMNPKTKSGQVGFRLAMDWEN